MIRRLGSSPCLAVLVAVVAWLVIPAGVLAHSELETSSPANGSTVDGPFAGPIVLTFSEDLAETSKADLLDETGDALASATVDGPGAKMTIELANPLAAGDYEVKWVSVADDGDLLRGTVSFTVAPPKPTPSPSPSPSPTPEASQAPTATLPATPSPTAAPATSPSPSPDGAASSSSDAILPIVAAVVVAAAGGAYLLSRRRSSIP
jgi:methionine-rich copper-binding protein CopC